MGNTITKATQSPDGYYSVNTCYTKKMCSKKGCTSQEECKTIEPAYQVKTKNAHILNPFMYNSSGAFYDKEMLETQIADEKKANDFVRKVYTLNHGETSVVPDSACVDISPCPSALKSTNKCCAQKDTFILAPNTFVEENPYVALSTIEIKNSNIIILVYVILLGLALGIYHIIVMMRK